MICVFTGGTSPNVENCEIFFKKVKEENKKVISIAADSGLETFEKFQKKYGIFELKSILGDWDSILDKSLIQKYPKNIIENHIVDKDYTDTELALEKAHIFSDEFSSSQIVLIGAGTGKRIDHLLAVFDIFSTNLRPSVWISGEQFLYFLPENSKIQIQNLKVDDMISFFRTTESRTEGKILSNGLKWESDLFRKEGVPSISNRISPEFYNKGKPIEIFVEQSNYILIVPFSAIVEFL